jgi:hypothetical protein
VRENAQAASEGRQAQEAAVELRHRWVWLLVLLCRGLLVMLLSQSAGYSAASQPASQLVACQAGLACCCRQQV